MYRRRSHSKTGKQSNVIILVLISPILVAINYGCTQQEESQIELKINDIQRLSSNGSYNVTGMTNLPDSSSITVAAVRTLRPAQKEQQNLLTNDNSLNRSILDRQNVEVRSGKWEAKLNLWKVSSNGAFQETWQANQNYMKLSPDSAVKFVAIFDPQAQWQRSDGQSQEKPSLALGELEGDSLRFTSEGEKFVQTSQNVAIALPTGKTVPPSPQAEDINGGWGNRHQLRSKNSTSVESLPSVTELKPTTNAALKASEYLR
ncbi:MAG: hypothetical protein AAF316_02560 [Cyanobacteria bacterium P01_A01_bin.80]